ncbi:hypothetical protein [Azospirillum sp.]|uniref:hypothetical protein n=1 Tax=Azospirillum sp. TaxID=34012 RepID=UPI003D763247
MAEYKPRGGESPAPPTADAQRLRHDIDSGRAGDKIPVEDPAAAPLGTDDEAAGTRPTGGVRPPPASHPPGHQKGKEIGSARGLGVAIASTLAVVAVVLAVVIVAT